MRSPAELVTEGDYSGLTGVVVPICRTRWAAASAVWRSFRSQILAHTNSNDRIPNPIGITTNAGPGSTSKTIPNSRTVPPITNTINRRAWRQAAMMEFKVRCIRNLSPWARVISRSVMITAMSCVWIKKSRCWGRSCQRSAASRQPDKAHRLQPVGFPDSRLPTPDSP